LPRSITPSAAARQLAGGDDTRIALVYSNPSSAYLSEFLMGSLDRAGSLNVTLTVERFDEDADLADLMARMQRGRLNGVLLPPPLCENEPMLAALRKEGLAVVAVAAGVPRPDVASVGIDDFHAAENMTSHLIALGHRRIGFIKGNPDQSASERRHKGYLSALEQAGIAPDPSLVAQGYFTYRSGLEAAASIWTPMTPPPRSSPAMTIWPQPRSPPPMRGSSMSPVTSPSAVSTIRRWPPPSGPN
jgi:LacI family transcriptional regulator